jgi:hypothetical protein
MLTDSVPLLFWPSLLEISILRIRLFFYTHHQSISNAVRSIKQIATKLTRICCNIVTITYRQDLGSGYIWGLDW